MPQLFITEQCNLPAFFETISGEDLQDCCDSSVYHRGRKYFEDGYVADASYNIGKTRLKTLVIGSSEYTVTINLQNGHIEGSCTCPYGGTCKHVIASLLYAIDEKSEMDIIPDAKNPGTNTDQYLQSLSKNELIALVKKFAPEQFWIEVKNKFSDNSSAQVAFRKAERAVQKIFTDIDYSHSPGDFTTALDKEIAKLSGLEKHLKIEIENLLFYIIGEVENAFDEGYLYDDYSDSSYEPSEEFNEFVVSFTKSLSYEEKTAFLIRLDALLSGQSYTTYESLRGLSQSVFTDDDLPALKDMLVKSYKNISQQLIEDYYERVHSLLTGQEKELILTEIKSNDSKWIIELASLFASRNQEIKAIDTIKDWLKKNNISFGIEKVYIIYLDMLANAGFSLEEAAKEAISHCSTCSMMQKIATLARNELPDYERILEKKAAGQLLEYLENNNRLPEALALINRSNSIWGTQVFNFFKKYKKNFSLEAEKYFCNELNKNLAYTGNNYYYIVADILQQIKQINRSLANEYLQDIRIKYKRRRSLIAILAKI